VRPYPVKEGGGCLSDQAGDYGRAVIETKLARHFPIPNSILASSYSRQRQDHIKQKPLKYCLTFIDTCDDC
jgi:hypothetical protein